MGIVLASIADSARRSATGSQSGGTILLKLHPPALVGDNVLTHVIFVHGLNGNYSGTFTSSGVPAELWPRWLEAIDGAVVWGLEYPAPASRWQSGTAMHLVDRARNVLPLLVHEPGLSQGAIVLVGYSLGGLVIKQMLRVAQDSSGHDEKVGSFVRRVRKVAFIATPHAGSDHASWMQHLSLLMLPREPTLGLVRNHAGLRDLNVWYRDFSVQHEITNLVLWETQPYHLTRRIFGREFAIPLGVIVKPDSSDPGLPQPAQIIPIDADHVSIVHPAGRDSDVYLHIHRFVDSPASGKHQDTYIRTALTEIRSAIDDHAAASGATTEKINAAINALGATGQRGAPLAENPIVTKVLEQQLWRLRKARHLTSFDALKEASRLFEDVQNGELAAASRQSKQIACAWCARIASSADIDASRVMLSAARTYGDGPENIIAEAFQKLHGDKDRDGALSLLANISSPMANSARFMIVRQGQTADSALAWMQAVGMELADLDADGKFILLSARVAAEQWNDAIKDADQLSASDFTDSPALEGAAACVHLVATVHDELKPAIFQHLPLDLKGFPLATDPAALDRRKKARDLFVQSAKALQDIGNPATAEDFALWLDLRNPATFAAALQALKESLTDPTRRLRRVPFAIEFGVPLEPVEVERAIDGEMARTGGKSCDAVRARLALSRTRSSDKDIASYIEQHHAQLTTYFHPNFINALLIEKLAASGDTTRAQSLLDSVAGTLGQGEIYALQAIVEEAKADDPTALREAQYASTQSLNDLGVLVDLLEMRQAWSKLVPYAKRLFDQTHDLSTLKRYIRSLQRVGDCREIEDLYGQHPEMFDAGGLINAVAWARFRLGRLHDAQVLLSQKGADAVKDFRLASNLAIGTGDWTALSALVEEEWATRASIDAADLLYAGRLAALAQSHRAKDLVKAAAKKAGGDAAILVGCYAEATGGGWEDDPETHGWLEEALQNAGSDGPIRRADLKTVLDGGPAWNEREDKTWKGMIEGRLPVAAAGLALNRSLLSMYLVPALTNLSQTDPRRRSVVFAFSGARAAGATDATCVALDATCLLALSYLGILKLVCERFDRVAVSPNTLSWLLEERKRIQFHQPSRVRRAQELKRCVDLGQVGLFDEIGVPDAKLEQEVGSALAQMLTAARSAGDERQHIVIRSYPLHRAGSLMDEIADVREYESHITAVGELVQALRGCGEITAAEADRAMTYLRLQEAGWPDSVTVQAGAVVYLDGLSVIYLQHLGLLARLKAAGLTALVSRSEINEADALIDYEAGAVAAQLVIEDIRATIAELSAKGKVVFGAFPASTGEHDAVVNHPVTGLFDLSPLVDAFAVDDRALNVHRLIKTEHGTKGILTTIDLLASLHASGVITSEELGEHLTKLRRGGFCLVPILGEELQQWLARTQLKDGALSETAELRAIRESIQRVRMLKLLQLPHEHVWLNMTSGSLIRALKAQWHDGTEESLSVARSEWLLDLLDIRGWAHRLIKEGDVRQQYASLVLALISLPDASAGSRKRYWRWLEDRVLRPMKEERDPSLQELLRFVEETVGASALQQFSEGE